MEAELPELRLVGAASPCEGSPKIRLMIVVQRSTPVSGSQSGQKEDHAG